MKTGGSESSGGKKNELPHLGEPADPIILALGHTGADLDCSGCVWNCCVLLLPLAELSFEPILGAFF